MLTEDDIAKMEEIRRDLKRYGISCEITPKELITYLTADSYENDIFTMREILDNR